MDYPNMALPEMQPPSSIIRAHIPDELCSQICLNLAEKISRNAPHGNSFNSAKLLAELGLSGHGDDIEDIATRAILAFIHRVIDSSDGNDAKLKPAVQLCLDRDVIRNAVLEDLSEKLHSAVRAIVRAHDDDDNSKHQTEESEFMHFCKDIMDYFGPAHITPQKRLTSDSGLNQSLDFASKIAFIRSLLMSGTINSLSSFSSERVLAYLLALSGASTKEVSSAAQEAVHVWLSNVSRSASVDSGLINQHFKASMARVRNCFSIFVPGPPRNRTFGLALWMRWLALADQDEQCLLATQEQSYWMLLQNVLRTGTTEQRKYCLRILAISVKITKGNVHSMVFNSDGQRQEEYSAAIDKYCMLFDTIAHGRYPNQVEECLPDLSSLFFDKSIIRESWAFTLLTVSLRKEIQEGIRSLIAQHVMKLAWRTYDPVPQDMFDFLSKGFLPWAMQGQLFSAPLERNPNGWTSSHGLSIQNFVKKLISVICMQATGKVQLIRALLSWMTGDGFKSISYGGCYMLAGLVSGLGEKEVLPLTADDISLILKTASRTDLTEIVKDLYTLYCFHLCKASAMDSSDLMNIPGYRMLCVAAQELQTGELSTANEGPFAVDSVDKATIPSPHGSVSLRSLNAAIQRNPGYFEKRNLVDSLVTIRRALNQLSLSEPCSDFQVLRILSATYDEIERQEYPKNALREWPALVFHPACLAIAKDSEELREFLIKKILELQKYTESRVYMFEPFWSAARTALLQDPAGSATELIPLETLFTRLANFAPVPKIEFLLESGLTWEVQSLTKGINEDHTEAKGRGFEYYFGKNQGYGYACFLDIVNRLHTIDRPLLQQTLDTLLQPWIAQKKPVPIVSKWKTTLQLQLLLILTEQCRPQWTAGQHKEYLKSFFTVLYLEPLPRFRFMLEWLIARLLIYSPTTADREEVLQALEKFMDKRDPKDLCSLIRLAAMTSCRPDTTPEYGLRLMTVMTRLTSNNKANIRHEAQGMYPILWDHAVKSEWKAVLSNPAFQAINDFIRSLPAYKEDSGFKKVLLDPVEDHSLVTLFEGSYLGMDPPGELIVTGYNFKRLWDDDKDAGMNYDDKEPLMSLGQLQPPGPFQPWSTMYPAQSNTKSTTPVVELAAVIDAGQATSTQSQAFLQTKGTAWQTQLLSPAGIARKPSELIIVATLIDNAHNLGGLSRIAEIFGAQSLHIADLTVTNSKEFISTSVSSHMHLPILPLAPDALTSFLSDRKREGYTVVGVEQTDGSQVLGELGTRLPKKCVLIMGAERTGIPGEVLVECDMCVEIKQEGVTRSLNVQTAAGIVGFEYQRQWDLNGNAHQ